MISLDLIFQYIELDSLNDYIFGITAFFLW